MDDCMGRRLEKEIPYLHRGILDQKGNCKGLDWPPGSRSLIILLLSALRKNLPLRRQIKEATLTFTTEHFLC